MSALPAIHTRQVAAILAVVPDQVDEVYALVESFAAEDSACTRGRVERLTQLAERLGKRPKQLINQFYAWKKDGVSALVDRRKAPVLWDTNKQGFSRQDEALLKMWVEKFQRKAKPAIAALREAWRQQRIPAYLAARGLTVPQTDTPIDPRTNYPRGWSARNLYNNLPSSHELAVVRIGRSAGKSELALTYTTRANLYVGQYYLWDDMWHDHEVVDLDQKKRGRPLEFHGLDLKSACKFIWGSRTRVASEVGHEGLKAADFRFVLAAGLTSTGYHASRGTTLIVEHGTAAIPETLERMLYDLTGGMIRVARSGMEGSAAHAAQYPGRSKGNFRFKAALESLGNLIHNEFAALPAQTGKDRQHSPEELHGRQKHTDALLAALSQLPEGRAAMLQWPCLTIQQFRNLCEEIYGRINSRLEHDLEGWDEHYVPSPMGGMRRLSPREVFQQGARSLTPINDETVAMLLGAEQGSERMVRQGMITVHSGEISGDELRFDATGLPDREKFLTVVNPFDAGRLFAYDAKGRFVGVLPRLHSVCRGDVEAVQRAHGAAAKREAEALAPLRQRHMAEARLKTAMHRHNADVLAGRPITPEERAAVVRDRERVAPLTDFLSGDSLPASASSGGLDDADTL